MCTFGCSMNHRLSTMVEDTRRNMSWSAQVYADVAQFVVDVDGLPCESYNWRTGGLIRPHNKLSTVTAVFPQSLVRRQGTVAAVDLLRQTLHSSRLVDVACGLEEGYTFYCTHALLMDVTEYRPHKGLVLAPPTQYDSLQSQLVRTKTAEKSNGIGRIL